MTAIGGLRIERVVLAVAAIWAAFMFIAAVAGVVINYSPVPYWDMWDGGLAFYLRASAGDWAVWFEQHNEHRIFLSRLLFWADMNWFQGRAVFLIAVNVILVAAAAGMFTAIIMQTIGYRAPSAIVLSVTLLVAGWLFYWAQYTNLTSAFQSQFFLVFLLPLCAFYSMHKAVGREGTAGSFVDAALFGLASAGAMANGVLALPLMVVYALITRQGVVRIVILALLAVGVLFLYFSNYHTPGGHGSLGTALREAPFQLLQYVLVYIGGPISYALGRGTFVAGLAMAASAVMVGVCAYVFVTALRQARANSLVLALLFFILYIGGTAFGTAGGRLKFGLDQALSSRYATPAIMAWAAFAVICLPYLLRLPRAGLVGLAGVGVLSLIVVGRAQLNAFNDPATLQYGRDLGALALSMQVRDDAQIRNVYPRAQRALLIARRTAETGKSVFGLYPWADLRPALGKPAPLAGGAACTGHVDLVEALVGEARYVGVRGWIYNDQLADRSARVRFVDADGQTAGFGLTGDFRPDLKKVLGSSGIRAGYRGYVLAGRAGNAMTIVAETASGPVCAMPARLATTAFKATRIKAIAAADASATAAAVVANEGWSGSDFQKTKVEGLRVFGSFVTGDKDRGAITLRLRRGDVLFYRSGPTGGRQLLTIGNQDEPAGLALPVARNWVRLEFTGQGMPTGPVNVTFFDNGNGWGEWSAIALRAGR